MGLMQTEHIHIQAEAYDVAVEIGFPRGTVYISALHVHVCAIWYMGMVHMCHCMTHTQVLCGWPCSENTTHYASVTLKLIAVIFSVKAES